jgi:hypothetical protein
MPSELRSLPRVFTSRIRPRPAWAAEAAVAVVVVLLLGRQVAVVVGPAAAVVVRLRVAILRVLEQRVELLEQLLAVPTFLCAVLGRLASHVHLRR